MYNPNGLHIQNRRTLPRAQMLEHHRRANYLTHTILDDYKFAVQMADAGCLYPVHRDSSWEPGDNLGNATRQQIREYAALEYSTLRTYMRRFESDDRRLLHMVNCEHALTDARMYLYVELMHLSANDPDGPIGFVFANEAAGSESHGFWVAGKPGHEYVHSANVWTRPARIEYLKTLHQYRNLRLKTGARAFIDGEHCYTYRYVNFAINGGQNKGSGHHRDWLDKAIEIDWSLPQDHLGRKFQAQYHALGWQWDRASKSWKPAPNRAQVMLDGEYVLPPYKIITEQLIDNMEGGGAGDVVDDGLIFKPPYTKAWGYNSMRPTWERWYPEFSPGEVLARMTEWAWKVIYAPTGFYIGGHTFSCGDTASKDNPPKEGDGWTPHNVIRPDGSPDQPYFDYMEKQHVRVDVKEGLPVMASAPLIDIAQYIFGLPGRAHTLSSGELCATQFDSNDNRRALFVKNGNSEEIAVFKGADGVEYIWRGLDTSRNEEELYYLTENGKPGSRWCPRYWREGQHFQRETLVTVRDKNTCKTKHAYVDKSYLKFVKYHTTYRFPSGITLPDVIELTWYYNPDQQTLERYVYAKGWGLVMWINGAGEAKTWVTSLNPSGMPKPKTWCDIAPIQLPKEVPVPSDLIPTNIGSGVEATIRQTRTMRGFPGLNGAEKGVLNAGDRVTYYPSTKKPGDSFDWFWTIRKSDGKAAWVAELNTGQSLFIPVVTQPTQPGSGPTIDELKGIFVTHEQLEALVVDIVANRMATAFPKAKAGS